MTDSLYEILNNYKPEPTPVTKVYTNEELLNFDFTSSDCLSEESMRNLEIERYAKQISEPIFNLLSGALSSIQELETHFKKFDQFKGASTNLFDNPTAFNEVVKKALTQLDDPFTPNFNKDIHARVEQKLISLNDQNLLLGFEYILDQMLMDRKIQRDMAEHNRQVHIEEFGSEHPDLSDFFEPEAIRNINNRFGE